MMHYIMLPVVLLLLSHISIIWFATYNIAYIIKLTYMMCNVIALFSLVTSVLQFGCVHMNSGPLVRPENKDKTGEVDK